MPRLVKIQIEFLIFNVSICKTDMFVHHEVGESCVLHMIYILQRSDMTDTDTIELYCLLLHNGGDYVRVL